MILGKTVSGFLVSSAMFTESSKPTMAKNASEVPAVTAMKIDLSSGVSNMTTREKSALPSVTAKTPTKITISRPLSSTQVSTTLALTLSATPRKLIKATSAMKTTARNKIRLGLTSTSAPSPRTTPVKAAKLAAKAREAVEAEVMPEHITVKQIKKVKKWMPNALWVYSAAPAACGYLVTSSR